MKPRIAIIGASYLQLPLLKKAQELGYETHVFAWQDGAVCERIADTFYPISVREKEAILKVCQRVKPQGIVSIASDIASVTVNYLARALGLPSNSQTSSLLTSDKYKMRQALAAAGVPCPAFYNVLPGQTMDANKLAFPLIVKPVDRSGSRGVRLVPNKTALHAALECAWQESFTKSAIVEEYITGREISVESISWEGKHYVLQFTDKETTGSPHFVETAHHQPAQLTHIMKKHVAAMTTRALTALGVQHGASHSEFMITPEGTIMAIEIGMRMGGDCIGSALVQLSTNIDYLKAVLEVATGSFTPPIASHGKFAGIYYLLPKLGIVRNIQYNFQPFVTQIESMVKVGDTIMPVHDSSQRAGYYIYADTCKQPFMPNILDIETELCV